MEEKRVLDDVFFKRFGTRYHALKEQGMIPVAICKTMSEELGCGKTTYYYYLREARDKGFVTDTYNDNMTARKAREAKIREMRKKSKDEPIETTLQNAIYGETTEEETTVAPVEEKEEEIVVVEQPVVCDDPDCHCDCHEESAATVEPQKKGFFSKLLDIFRK